MKKKLRAIYYDTETTGVQSANDRIIEIAAYDPLEERTFVELINPGCPIPKEASAIHHITDEMVKDAAGFDVVGKAFIEFCSDDAVLIAHNNDGFDIHFLREEFKRADLPPPFWPTVDSLKWARKYRNDLPRHSLQFLREAYNIEANQAHRALDDVKVLYQIFSQMIDDLSIETVLKLMAEEAKISRMPFGKHRGTPLEDVPKSYVRWLKESGAFDKPDSSALKENFEKLGFF